MCGFYETPTSSRFTNCDKYYPPTSPISVRLTSLISNLQLSAIEPSPPIFHKNTPYETRKRHGKSPKTELLKIYKAISWVGFSRIHKPKTHTAINDGEDSSIFWVPEIFGDTTPLAPEGAVARRHQINALRKSLAVGSRQVINSSYPMTHPWDWYIYLHLP